MARKLNHDEEAHFIEALSNPQAQGEPVESLEAVFMKSLANREDYRLQMGPELAAWFGIDVPPRPGSW